MGAGFVSDEPKPTPETVRLQAIIAVRDEMQTGCVSHELNSNEKAVNAACERILKKLSEIETN